MCQALNEIMIWILALFWDFFFDVFDALVSFKVPRKKLQWNFNFYGLATPRERLEKSSKKLGKKPTNLRLTLIFLLLGKLFRAL